MTDKEKLESAEAEVARLENIVRIQIKQIERLLDEREILRLRDMERMALASEIQRLRKLVSDYSKAWNLYKVFPSFANEKLFADAELSAKMEAFHLGATGWESDNKKCQHVHVEGSTVCTICGE